MKLSFLGSFQTRRRKKRKKKKKKKKKVGRVVSGMVCTTQCVIQEEYGRGKNTMTL